VMKMHYSIIIDTYNESTCMLSLHGSTQLPLPRTCLLPVQRKTSTDNWTKSKPIVSENLTGGYRGPSRVVVS